MKIYLGADHAGFDLKEKIKEHLTDREGIEVFDVGAKQKNEDDDYPGYAFAVAEKVARDKDSGGVMVCGSGEGMAIAANKVKGIRASVVWDVRAARETKNDNDANVISLPARYIDWELALEIVDAWLRTKPFDHERHQRRVEQIRAYEDEHLR